MGDVASVGAASRTTQDAADSAAESPRELEEPQEDDREHADDDGSEPRDGTRSEPVKDLQRASPIPRRASLLRSKSVPAARDMPEITPGMVQVIVEDEVFEEHGVILAASPVLARLITTAMKQTGSRRICLADKSRAEFREVLCYLRPSTMKSQKIVLQNVDYLAKWFHELELQSLKDECEEVLLRMPASVDRLVQAHSLGLQRQYRRCLEDLCSNLDASLDRILLEVPLAVMQDVVSTTREIVRRSRSESSRREPLASRS